MRRLLLDANLLLVFVVGSVDRALLGVAKRVKEYSPEDYDIIAMYVSQFEETVLLPNTVSEACNLIDNLKGERRTQCMLLLADLARASPEVYVASSVAVEQGHYVRLGVTDAAILCLLDRNTLLLTADHALYLAATGRSANAQYFGHLQA